MEKDPIFKLADQIRETAFSIHNYVRYVRYGHLEKVYENALAHRLRKQGLDAIQQHPLSVFDEDGTPIGDYFADLFVEQKMIVELKAVKALIPEHTASYLAT